MTDHTHLEQLGTFVTTRGPLTILKKKQLCTSTYSWGQADSAFGITLGKPRHAWQDPLEMAK